MRQPKTFYFFLFSFLIGFLYLGCKGIVEDEVIASTIIRIQGDITAIKEKVPIGYATVKLEKIDGLYTSELLEQVRTGLNGHYNLKYIERGHCGESLLSISASANGYNYVSYFSSSPNHVRCTNDIQTINFQLEKK